MLHQTKRNTLIRLPRLSLLLALAAGITILLQLLVTLLRGEPLCLNQGCEIVEQSTRIASYYFNLAGLLFFLTVFFCLRRAREGSRPGALLAQSLLLTAMGIEAVLIGYQLIITKTFCSYCLFIFLFVLLLNLAVGLRHFSQSLLLFLSVTAAFILLEYKQPHAPSANYTEGVYGTRSGDATKPHLYLFFSSNCPHCEEIISILEDFPDLSISFNPVNIVEEFDVPRLEQRKAYSTAVNRQFLEVLDIHAVPVLLVRSNASLALYQGKDEINSIIAALSNSAERENEPASSQWPASRPTSIPGLPDANDSCSVEAGCKGAGSGSSLPKSVSP